MPVMTPLPGIASVNYDTLYAAGANAVAGGTPRPATYPF